MKTFFMTLIKLFIKMIFVLLFYVPTVDATNQDVKIGIPFVPKDALKQEALSLFGGRVSDQNILIISKPEPYANGIQIGEFDAFFSKANIGAWAIANHPYEAVAKLRDPVFLRLVARNDQLDVFEFKDLSYRTICTEGSPDMTFHFLQTLFDKPGDISERRIFFPEEKIETLLNRHCIGKVVNESRLKLLADKKDYVTLARSQEFAQIGFFIRKDISQNARKHIVDRLFSAQSKALIDSLKRYFSTPTDEFIKASNDDYLLIWAEYTPKQWRQP